MRNIGGEYGVKNEREECNEIIMYRLPSGDRVKYPSGQGENFKQCYVSRDDTVF